MPKTIVFILAILFIAAVSEGLKILELESEFAKASGPILWTLNGEHFGVRDRQHAIYTFCRLQWFVYEKTGKLYLEDKDPSFEDSPRPEWQIKDGQLKPQ